MLPNGDLIAVNPCTVASHCVCFSFGECAGDITDEEKIWGLELTHIICLLHPKSKKHFNISQHMEPFLGFLQVDKLQYGGLQALESLLCESKDIQEVIEFFFLFLDNLFNPQPLSLSLSITQSFERMAGLKIVSKLLLQTKVSAKTRWDLHVQLVLFFVYVFAL